MTLNGGMACRRWHVAGRTPHGHCVECKKITDLVFKIARPERQKVYSDKYRSNHAAEVSARERKYRLENPDKIRETQIRYHQANKPKLAARMRAYRRRKPEIVNAPIKRWLAKNPEKAKEYQQRRRSRKVNAPGNFTGADWLALVAKSPHCHWCKRLWTNDRRPTHDHVIPLVRNGANSLENSVCACRECNSRKHATLIHPVSGQGLLL